MEKQAGPAQLMTDPGFLLSRVGAAVRAGFKDVLAGWGVRPQQYLILLILDARGGASQQELCTGRAHRQRQHGGACSTGWRRCGSTRSGPAIRTTAAGTW